MTQDAPTAAVSFHVATVAALLARAYVRLLLGTQKTLDEAAPSMALLVPPVRSCGPDARRAR